MGAVDEIRRAGVELRPPLAESAIGELAEEVGAPLPAELRELLGVTAGTDEPVELDFTGQSLSFGDEDIFPACHPFAGDGSGNHWVLDLTSASTERAAVFFACHDPPVVVYEAPDLAHFLRDVLARGALADDAHAQRVSRIWNEDHPVALSHAQAAAADDELRAFAASLDERFVFVDLRDPERGDGFSWGRHGPRTVVRRHGDARLFAYAPPEKKRGLLSRLRR
jgi:hypothetical protein